LVVLFQSFGNIFTQANVKLPGGVSDYINLMDVGLGHKSSAGCGAGLKLVAGAGFEPAIPHCGIMSLTSFAIRLDI
jgi:hypothetical protein